MRFVLAAQLNFKGSVCAIGSLKTAVNTAEGCSDRIGSGCYSLSLHSGSSLHFILLAHDRAMAMLQLCFLCITFLSLSGTYECVTLNLFCVVII